MLNRRGLITGLISFVAAPAIVRAASLMPVKAIPEERILRILWRGLPIEIDEIKARRWLWMENIPVCGSLPRMRTLCSNAGNADQTMFGAVNGNPPVVDLKM